MNNEYSQVEKNEKIYFDYLEEANKVRKEYWRAYRPFMIPALLAWLLAIAQFFIGMTAPRIINYRGVYTASHSYIFWLGLLIALILGVIGTLHAKKRANEEARRKASLKVGFEEFYKLHFTRRWWPKKMVTGEKYDKFLSIINQNKET